MSVSREVQEQQERIRKILAALPPELLSQGVGRALKTLSEYLATQNGRSNGDFLTEILGGYDAAELAVYSAFCHDTGRACAGRGHYGPEDAFPIALAEAFVLGAYVALQRQKERN